MKIRVFVVDDTVVYRKILSDVLNTFQNVELIGAAPSGRIALQKMAQTPVDLVMLDVAMPEMDGVETLRRIKEQFPDTAAVMVSGASDRQADTTIQALELGALDFIQKPESADYSESIRILADRIRPTLRLIETRMLTRGVRSSETPKLEKTENKPVTQPALVWKNLRPAPIDLVVIGVSTGGPNALATVIPGIPANLGAPIMLVQHMPPLFTASLAEHLSKISKAKVVEAHNGQPLTPGTVFIAPGGRHLVLQNVNGNGLQAVISDAMPVNSCRPSADVLFQSVADTFTGGVLAVILTGMGEDGAAGVAALKRAGGYCLAQNEETCVVYGMPRAVIERGLADEILPLENIAPRISELVKKRI